MFLPSPVWFGWKPSCLWLWSAYQAGGFLLCDREAAAGALLDEGRIHFGERLLECAVIEAVGNDALVSDNVLSAFFACT